MSDSSNIKDLFIVWQFKYQRLVYRLILGWILVPKPRVNYRGSCKLKNSRKQVQVLSRTNIRSPCKLENNRKQAQTSRKWHFPLQVGNSGKQKSKSWAEQITGPLVSWKQRETSPNFGQCLQYFQFLENVKIYSR